MATLTKKQRTGYKKIKVVSLKPPAIIKDEDEQPTGFEVVFVTKQGSEHKLPCTKEVWKVIEGKNVLNQSQNGLDARLDCNFRLLQSKSNAVVEYVDIIRRNNYAGNQAQPDSAEEIKEVGLTIDPKTGNIEVKTIPTKVAELTVDALISALDELDEVVVGDTIGGKFYITDITKNGMSVEVQ